MGPLPTRWIAWAALTGPSILPSSFRSDQVQPTATGTSGSGEDKMYSTALASMSLPPAHVPRICSSLAIMANSAAPLPFN